MNDSARLRELLLLPRHLREQPEVVSAIREAITQDEAALRCYVSWMRFESNLHWVLQEENCSPSLVVSELRKQVWRIRLLYLSVASAVMLMLAAGLRYYSYIQERAAVAEAALLDADSRMVWTAGGGQSGTVLRNGDRLTALEGRFLLRMQCGAVVACEAPVDIEVRDAWEVFLHHGEICVQVPPGAHGFRARSRVGTVVDLGTVFGMRVRSGGDTEIQVLEGSVEVSPVGAGPQSVPAGVARRITGEGRLSPPEPVDPAALRSQLAALIGISSISPAIIPALPPPRSVRSGAQLSASTGYVFRERSHLVTAEPLELYAADPGRYNMDRLPELTVVPASVAVTTYFIHAENTVETPVDGELTFAGEILGLALSSEQLNGGDSGYGHPDVLYPDEPRRKTVVKEVDDEIEVSADRRTLKLHISCSVGGFDQIRVFVRAPQSDR